MSNPYSLILKEYISNSRMSLTEIENEMRKRGFNKNKAYLSNLQNGKMDPPPFDVTHVLCDVIGGDPVRLALTGVLMEISEQEFFPFMTDTIATMLATLLDINKDKWSVLVSDFFSSEVSEVSKEEVMELFNYDTLKNIIDEALKEIPYKTIFESAIDMEMNGDRISTKILMDTLGTQSEVMDDLTKDEDEYLKECLAVYRKMKLRPIRLDTSVANIDRKAKN
ncbi:MAG: hypothetical protein IE909_18925 [Campylobacterales bacterium]|nr:hypothetical protein [Campylobacterales bacterium]